MFLSKGRVFLLRADPASEGPTVQKLQHPPHTHTQFKNGRKQRKGGGYLIITIMIIKIYGIGVGRFRILGGPRFRILGGQGLEYWGAKGAKFPACT